MPPSPSFEPAAHWPAGEIPVEIFDIIISHLKRSEVKTLRLVSKEFEAKVSAQYFKDVVVPFRSELYRGRTGGDSGAATPYASPGPFSNGMRIFESFGPHILRFALSLEHNEDSLAHPPVKPVQEAIAAFWGIYRWPHETYHRYTDLEGLEETADETEYMKAALRCLSKVKNIGLCCDAGLGFLIGPDKPSKRPRVRPPVFDVNDWHQPPRFIPLLRRRVRPIVVAFADANGSSQASNPPAAPKPESHNRRVLEKMVTDAGYCASQVDEAIDLLLKTECTTLANITFDERPAKANREGRSTMRLPIRDRRPAPEDDLDSAPSKDLSLEPLLPATLTRPQKEMLLELEWAHRAMIQSYVLGLTDNAAAGCFDNLTTLTISKIPGCHLNMLCREELWGSLSTLTTVALGVIPDWRVLTKPTPECVEDVRVSPVDTVAKVFTLLNEHVGKQRGIESIRFEWICGGELAQSSYQRNQFILPAPFVSSPALMTWPTTAANRPDALLDLPYVKHLHLKNCWFAPHIMMETIREMALCSLEKLELESVSLSGPPIHTPQRTIQFHPMAHALSDGPSTPSSHALLSFYTTHGPPIVLPTARPPTRHPEMLSWAGFMELFHPGPPKRRSADDPFADPEGVLAALWAQRTREVERFLPRADRLAAEQSQYRVKSLSFKSCGYVFVDDTFINARQMLPPDVSHSAYYVRTPRQDMSGSMQYCKDKLLGRVMPYISDSETAFLERDFGMSFGWEGVYSEAVVNDAIADGIDSPGSGRFTGILDGVDRV